MSSSKKTKQTRKKLGVFLSKNSYFVFLPFVLFGSYALSSLIQAETDVLTVIVTASSFIVAIITGFLINSYYGIKQLRWDKLNRFADLQNQLRDYAWAFWSLTFSITRNHNLDWRFPKSIEELEHDTDWVWGNKDSTAVMFIRYLKDFARYPNDIPDFELTHAAISKAKLEQMHEYMIRASGILTRYKHFKHILKSFELTDTNDLDKVIITNDSNVEISVKKLKKENQDFRTLGFWQVQIEECVEILDRMKMNGKFIYSFSVFEIKQLGLNLMFLSVFGILLPITVLIVNDSIPSSYQSFLTIVSSVGFMLYFILGVSRIFSKLSSSRLSYS